ncbi:MAG: hypothetical protein U1E63_15725 [Burkholderiales bacterium]
MHQSPPDLGLVQVLLDELQKHTLPRTLDLKEKVDRGEPLDEFEQTFLEQALDLATRFDTLTEHHVEYQALAARVSHLYHEITAKALQNASQHS